MHHPVAQDPRSLNTYLSLTKEKMPATTWENAMQEIESAQSVTDDINQYLCLCLERHDRVNIAHCLQFSHDINLLKTELLDAATLYMLNNNDKFEVENSQQKFETKTDDVSVGLWVNFSSKRRVGLSQPIAFADLNIHIDIPKIVAQHILAMRVVRTLYDNITYVSDDDFPPEVTEEEAASTIFSEEVLTCADLLHEQWKEKRKQSDFTYEPRVKIMSGKVKH